MTPGQKHPQQLTYHDHGKELKGRYILWIQPPTKLTLDRTFTGALIRYQNLFLQLQTLSAWYATLGGGYFFCRHLSKSLALARCQRHIAALLGDVELMRTSQLHEAYNLMYAGRFRQAKRVLKELWNGTIQNSIHHYDQEDNRVLQRTRRQCKAAWLLVQRLASMASTIVPSGIHSQTIDDYQRIRIVIDPDNYHAEMPQHHKSHDEPSIVPK